VNVEYRVAGAVTPSCLACGGPTFRTVKHPVSEQNLPLYPMAGTKFLVIEIESGGIVSGFALCPDCASRQSVDLGNVAEKVPGFVALKALVPARERSGWWYSDRYGVHLEAWLRDHLRLDPEPYVRQWRADCVAEGVAV